MTRWRKSRLDRIGAFYIPVVGVGLAAVACLEAAEWLGWI